MHQANLDFTPLPNAQIVPQDITAQQEAIRLLVPQVDITLFKEELVCPVVCYASLDLLVQAPQWLLCLFCVLQVTIVPQTQFPVIVILALKEHTRILQA